jgi:alpha-D-xyloside xylohydrolase
MRLHGNRVRHSEARPVIEQSGDPNEIWSFGEQAFEIIKGILATREKLRPYISEQMKIASQKGWPIIRPMFFEFPDDKNCWETKGQYMFGEDILFAPVTKQGAKSVLAYLPKGKWVLTKDGKEYCGERLHEIDVEINEYVAFVKKGAKVLECFK